MKNFISAIGLLFLMISYATAQGEQTSGSSRLGPYAVSISIDGGEEYIYRLDNEAEPYISTSY